jgi:integrase
VTRRHFGNVRKLPSGRYQASYWNRGSRHIASDTFPAKADALAYLSTVETDLRRGEWIDLRDVHMTVADLAHRWLLSNPAKRPDTYATDEYHLRSHILPSIGSFRIADVTPVELQAIVNGWAGRLAPRTVRRAYGVVRAVFAYGVAADMIGRTPCRAVKLPRVESLARRTPTPEEVARLAAAMREEYRPMVYLGAILGLRFSEVAGLRVGRLDLLGKSLSVEETVTRDAQGRPVFGPPKSAASRRTVALPTALAEMLAEQLRRRGITGADADELVFVSPDGGPLRYANWRTRVWVPACRQAGLDGLGFHDLRRASATALVLGRVDLKTAQTRLGHSDPRLTIGLYAQVVDQADRAASDLLGQHFLPPSRTERARSAHD